MAQTLRPRAFYKLTTQRSAPLRLLPHEASPVTESWRTWALRQEKPRAVDLFSGAGGMSLGLEQAGYTVILSVDHDPWALETHRHNFPGAALDLDLSDPEKLQTLIRILNGINIDLIAGGPPCQPFSRAGRSKIRSLVEDGKRPARDQRKDLWQSFLHVVEAVRPQAVLMENVPDMALGDDLLTIRKMIQRLEAVNYEVEVALLDAWRYGVPQHRQRLILVALQNGATFHWPKEQHKISLVDAIGDLPCLDGETGSREQAYSGPKNKFQRTARVGMTGKSSKIIWDHITRPVRDDDRQAFELMADGSRYSDLPKHLRRYRDDIFDDKYHRLQWTELSRSITAHIAKDGYWYIHPMESRTLSVREAARIQTFPDQFRFAGTRSHAFSQIGNAVPPALAKVVATALLEETRRSPVPEHQRWSRKLPSIHDAILSWANKDRKIKPWRHPGDPWAVLAATLLQKRADADTFILKQFLAKFPDPSTLNVAALRSFKKQQESPQHDSGLSRLLAVARSLSTGGQSWTGEGWSRAAKLTPAQDAWMSVVGLQDNGRILLNAGILRSVSRLIGKPLEAPQRLSDGKLAVARILGASRRAPDITAALSAISYDFCRPTKPTCEACPLAHSCATSNVAT